MLKYRKLTKQVIKEFYNVYNELGTGFLESIYENALAIALRDAGLNIETQYAIPVYFRDIQVGKFRADIIVENKVILELKAVNKLQRVHEAQLLNYLKATHIEIGLLLNFGDEPNFKRRIFNK